MRERVDAFGVVRARAAAVGREPDRGQPPGRRQRRARGPAGRLDRPAVLLRLGSEHPRRDTARRTRTRTPAQKTPITGFYNAVKRASKCPPQKDGNNNAADAPRFYAFDKITKQPLNNGQPSDSQEAALEDLDRRAAGERRGGRGPRGHPRRPRPRSRTPTLPTPTAGGSSRTTRRSRAPTSRTRSRPPTSRPATSRSSPSTSRTRAVRRSTTSRARSPSAGSDNSLPARQPDRRVAALRDRARQRADLGAVHQLPRAPGRHRRLERRPDLRLVHDRLRAGPGEDPRDRRAADPPRADLALAGLGHARRPGARPGPGRRRSRASSSSRSS